MHAVVLALIVVVQLQPPACRRHQRWGKRISRSPRQDLVECLELTATREAHVTGETRDAEPTDKQAAVMEMQKLVCLGVAPELAEEPCRSSRASAVS